MSKQVRLRRGTTSQHSSFTGAQGEVTVDTDKKVVVVHDGSTAGGISMFPSTGGYITGRIVLSHSTPDANSAEIQNTSATGYGPFFRGGSSTRYAAIFFDYNTVNQLMMLSGTGALTVAQGGTFGGNILPANDNSIDCGSGSLAIKQIYSNNSVIVTSDARLKTARPYEAKERAVARRCRDLGVVYQWNDAIAQKGVDRARRHFGTTVQSVIAAFEAEGLDPMRYGVVCYDEWEAEVIEHPAIEGREAYTETVRQAGNRYSLRLDQLAFFIVTAGA